MKRLSKFGPPIFPGALRFWMYGSAALLGDVQEFPRKGDEKNFQNGDLVGLGAAPAGSGTRSARFTFGRLKRRGWDCRIRGGARGRRQHKRRPRRPWSKRAIEKGFASRAHSVMPPIGIWARRL